MIDDTDSNVILFVFRIEEAPGVEEKRDRKKPRKLRFLPRQMYLD